MIQKLFDYDGPFMRFFNLLSRLTLSSLLWLLLCLPIVTAGASTAGLYACAETLRTGGTKIVPVFFEAFKRYFKPASLMWLLTAIPLTGFILGFFVLKENGIELPAPVIYLCGAALLVLVFVCLWFYPILFNFKGTFWELFSNSFIFAFLYIPFTAIAGALLVGMVWLFRNFAVARIFLVIFGAGLFAYAALSLFDKPLSKYRKNDPNGSGSV